MFENREERRRRRWRKIKLTFWVSLAVGTAVALFEFSASPLQALFLSDYAKKLTFKVTEAMPAVKGDTSSGRVTKEVTLETGMKIQVPIFIEQGESVVVNTESGEYVERA